MTLPYTFANNTRSNASEIMANFEYLRDNISATPYKFGAYKASNSQNVTTATITKVTLDSEYYDVNGDFDTSTSTYTAPVDGYYVFTYQSGYSTGNIDGKRYQQLLYRNGTGDTNLSNWTIHNAGSTTHDAWMSSLTVGWCDAGDEITLQTYHSFGSTLACGYMCFHGHYLGTNDLALKRFRKNRLTDADDVNTNFSLLDQYVAQNLTIFKGVVSSQTIPTNTTTKLELTPLYDAGGDWDSSNNDFVVPVSGFYLVNGMVNYSTAGDGKYISGVIHSSNDGNLNWVKQKNPTGNTMGVEPMDIYYFEQGDRISIKAYHEVGGDATVANSNLSIVLISTTTDISHDIADGDIADGRKLDQNFSWRNANISNNTNRLWADMTNVQTINSASTTTLSIDRDSGNDLYDPENAFDTGTYTWTCPEDGYYLGFLYVRNIQAFNNGNRFQIRFVNSGSGAIGLMLSEKSAGGGSSTMGSNVPFQGYFQTGDTLYARAYHNYGSSRTFDAEFKLTLLSK